MSWPTSIPPESLETSPETEVPQQTKEFIRLQAMYLVGAKVTIYFPSIAGPGRLSAWAGTLLDLPETHGFITPGGGWSLIYVPRGEHAEPSYRILARGRRRRRKSYVRLDDAYHIRMGW